MVEQVDTLVLGAGLSGVAAGYYLQKECPGTSYAILEMRDEVGGTWSLFKYPGIRSDSDMATFGYPFRPWPKAESLGEGPEIRQYIEDTAKEFGIFEKIRFRHKVISANWSPEKARWEVVARRLDTDEEVELEAKFLLSCMGYYDYDEGYTPEFPGRERFKGTFVHPQHWPEDLDYTGKRVVVIGSGATAVTLIPAMADKVEKITMLQRSPSYVFSIPARDKIAELFQRVLPEHYAAEAKRWKNVLLTQGFYEYCQAFPDRARKLLMDGVRKKVGDGFDVDTHFNPRYNPWDQRLCAVPASDLFKAIRSGKADVITDTIETFTEDGIHLSGGGDLKADIIVSATGLNVKLGGGVKASLDGEEIHMPDHYVYRGSMFSDVPNFLLCIGYTNASWTLKIDLQLQYACRLMNHMRDQGFDTVTPRVGPDVQPRPLIDMNSGYFNRVRDQLPKNGDRMPWKLAQNYVMDRIMLRRGKLDDGTLEFGYRKPSRKRKAA